MRIVGVGAGGANGRAGALIIPPTSGKNGATGTTVNYTNPTNISTTNQIGIEAGSIGGKGGMVEVPICLSGAPGVAETAVQVAR